MTKDTPSVPVPVVPTSEAQQWRRFCAFAAMAAGAALKTVAENAPAIQSQYPAAKWLGGVLFVAGLIWKAWQSFGDMGNITRVDLSPSAAPVDANADHISEPGN